jgi:hypothetical protein
MRSSETWENLAEVLRVIQPALEAKLAFFRNHPPDPAIYPVTSALIAAYKSRLELELSTLRGGAAGLKDEASHHPTSMRELQELESWIMRKKPGTPRPKLAVKDEDALGNWFVSKMGFSYSQAKQMIESLCALQSGKGAPSKRIETVKLMDARIANGWSYSELATKMCDCGAKKHTKHCSERIRKRLKELESVLAKYGIRILPAPEKNPR